MGQYFKCSFIWLISVLLLSKRLLAYYTEKYNLKSTLVKEENMRSNK